MESGAHNILDQDRVQVGVHLQWQGYIFAYSQRIQQGAVLEHNADAL